MSTVTLSYFIVFQKPTFHWPQVWDYCEVLVRYAEESKFKTSKPSLQLEELARVTIQNMVAII